MALVIGTNDGVWRAPESNPAQARRELAVGVGPLRVPRVRTFGDSVYAATRTGLFRSDDGGTTWTDLAVPNEDVYSVAVSPDGERVYAGTHPVGVFVSEPGGREWRELEGFHDLPSREEWHAPRHSGAKVRSLRVHPDAPDRVVAGVEAGGVHVSDDRGESWTERKSGVYDDIHHLRTVGPDEFVAATGRGLYRSRDAGRSWRRLDEADDRSYFRETIRHDAFYTAVTPEPSSSWSGESGAAGVLLESDDDGETFEEVSFPGGPVEVVLAWATADERLFAGTDRGRLLVRQDDGWTQAGRVSTGIRSLTVV